MKSRKSRTFMIALTLLIAVSVLFWLTFPEGDVNIAAMICLIAYSVGSVFLFFALAGWISTHIHIEKQKNQAEHEKREFAEMVAHQMQEPLTTIRWIVEMILDGDVGKIEDQTRRVLQDLSSINHRTNGLLRDLINFSRINEEDMEISVEKIRPDRVVREVLDDLNAFATYKGIGIESNIEKMKIELDSKLFREVVQNLVENAIRYSRRGGKVKVILENQEKQMKLRITDSGIGIPKEERGKIFNKFFRASNVHNSSRGTGLGLYFARKVIRSLGGTIYFVSKEGVGTTFYIEISK